MHMVSAYYVKAGVAFEMRLFTAAPGLYDMRLRGVQESACGPKLRTKATDGCIGSPTSPLHLSSDMPVILALRCAAFGHPCVTLNVLNCDPCTAPLASIKSVIHTY